MSTEGKAVEALGLVYKISIFCSKKLLGCVKLKSPSLFLSFRVLFLSSSFFIGPPLLFRLSPRPPPEFLEIYLALGLVDGL